MHQLEKGHDGSYLGVADLSETTNAIGCGIGRDLGSGAVNEESENKKAGSD